VAAFDLYHFMWMEHSIGWQETEINFGGATGVFSVTPASAGLFYEFKIQGCISRTIGLDDCSSFSLPTIFQMPPNTRSLRAFLSLSGLSSITNIRSLGASGYGAGLRSMMHL
jgi:hypothetical protein